MPRPKRRVTVGNGSDIDLDHEDVDMEVVTRPGLARVRKTSSRTANLYRTPAQIIAPAKYLCWALERGRYHPTGWRFG